MATSGDVPGVSPTQVAPGADAPKVNGHQMVVVGIFPKLGGASVFRTLRYLEATDPAVPSCGYIGDSCIHAL